MKDEFRSLIPSADNPRLAAALGCNAYQHAERAYTVPRLTNFLAGWKTRLAAPFVGITCDGHKLDGLYPLVAEGAPCRQAVAAAQQLLTTVSVAQRARLCHAIEASEWRQWSNPEFYINRQGLRLEEVSGDVRTASLALLAASLSEQGFAKARGCMQINAFLGELVGVPAIMNEFSYNISLFGSPSEEEPWGWQFFGHHLALNCFFLGQQMVVSPVFMGAEPNWIDVGEHAGLSLFDDEERIGLSLMQSLSPALQRRAQIYPSMRDPAMPPDRWQPQDQRHLGGAFHDNRVIPYEGIAARELNPLQRRQLLDLLAAYFVFLPQGPRTARMASIERHLEATWFSWIGAYGAHDAFYYRVQSPVVMVEFDHHSGVWLSNAEPAKCHTHTVIRTPNGNDYGRDLLKEHFRAVHSGRQSVREGAER